MSDCSKRSFMASQKTKKELQDIHSKLAELEKIRRQQKEILKNKADIRKSKLLKELQDKDNPKHGTTTAYQAGCRCDKCRQAAHQYYEQSKSTQKEIKVDGVAVSNLGKVNSDFVQVSDNHWVRKHG